MLPVMLPRHLTAILGAALWLTACGREPHEPQKPRPAITLRGETIDVGRALADIRALAVDIGPRPTGEPAEARAAEWLATTLTSYGYRVHLQPVPLPDGGASANVVALPSGLGFDPVRERYLLAGAHYDTVPASPGANDNASGVAVLLETARILSVRPARLPVVFVAFGGEEGRPGPRHLSLAGSLHYVEAMSPEEKRNLAAMLNIDMVAHGDALLATRRINMKRGFHQRLLTLGGRLGVPVRENGTPQMSDSVPFASQGIETGWLWTGVEPVYHSPQDTMEKLTPVSLDWAGRLTLAALRSF